MLEYIILSWKTHREANSKLDLCLGHWKGEGRSTAKHARCGRCKAGCRSGGGGVLTEDVLEGHGDWYQVREKIASLHCCSVIAGGTCYIYTSPVTIGTQASIGESWLRSCKLGKDYNRYIRYMRCTRKGLSCLTVLRGIRMVCWKTNTSAIGPRLSGGQRPRPGRSGGMAPTCACAPTTPSRSWSSPSLTILL